MERFNTVAEYLSDPKRWCKGQLCKTDNFGNVIACCVEGAIIYVIGKSENPLQDQSFGNVEVYFAMRKVSDIIPDRIIWKWQDDPHTTHEQVLEVVKKAKI